MIAARPAVVLVAAALIAGCGHSSEVPLADGSDTSVQKAITGVTTFPTELDPRLWNETELKPEIRQMSLKIVDRIVATPPFRG